MRAKGRAGAHIKHSAFRVRVGERVYACVRGGERAEHSWEWRRGRAHQWVTHNQGMP